jgi:hypothetical protein
MHLLAVDKHKSVSERAVVSAALCLLAGAGCSSDSNGCNADGCSSDVEASAAEVPLCNGSTQLTLRVFYASQSAREVFGGAVRIENGFPSFAVDGQCQYFMSGGWFEDQQARDHGWRQGTVSDELRSTLEAKAGAADLPAAYDCEGPGAVDASPAIISNARSTVICPSDAKQAVVEMMAVIRQRARELWATGRPLDGDLRITVRAAGNEPPRRYRWPAGLALRDYLEPDSSTFVSDPVGRSKRVAAADAAPLRAIREEFLRDTRPGVLYVGDGIPITDGQISATLFMRDALPYEDEQGILPLPEASR